MRWPRIGGTLAHHSAPSQGCRAGGGDWAPTCLSSPLPPGSDAGRREVIGTHTALLWPVCQAAHSLDTVKAKLGKPGCALLSGGDTRLLGALGWL